MQRSVVEVGAGSVAIPLFLVADIVFHAVVRFRSTNNLPSLNADLLHSFDGVICRLTTKVWVATKALPVTASGGDASHVGHRAENDIHTLATELFSQSLAAEVHELLVESGRDIDTGRESSHVIAEAYAEWGILQA